LPPLPPLLDVGAEVDAEVGAVRLTDVVLVTL
jgi:hypothetical protein